MYRVVTNITFTQQPNTAYKTRNKVITYNFCHELEVSSTWDTLTDDGAITLPKNVYIVDKSGNKISLEGTNKNIGGFDNNAPFFLRGDKVTIKWGYAYNDARGNEVIPVVTIFEGYISEVSSKKPFVIKIEDNMWKLKQVPAVGNGNRKFFGAKTYTIESMLREMIQQAGLSFTVNDLTNTTAGDFIVGNETIAQVLARLRKEYNFKSYFRGNELRIGAKVYIDEDLINPITKKQKTPFKFIFQQNIISDELEYQRKEDIVVSTVAKTVDEEDTGHLTKDGHTKTKKVKREVLITLAYGSDTPTYDVATKTHPIPENTGGQRFTDTFPRGTSLDKLKELGLANLKLRYYTGFRGKITTFGLPFVQFGDNIDILDNILPERNGRYKVKSVKYTGGVNGLRQEIELDYLIFRLDAKGNVIQ